MVDVGDDRYVPQIRTDGHAETLSLRGQVGNLASVLGVTTPLIAVRAWLSWVRTGRWPGLARFDGQDGVMDPCEMLVVSSAR
jgi:hypothetical protein